MDVEHRRGPHKDRKSNCCTTSLNEEICVDFDVTFAVEVANVEINDVSCGGQ